MRLAFVDSPARARAARTFSRPARSTLSRETVCDTGSQSAFRKALT